MVTQLRTTSNGEVHWVSPTLPTVLGDRDSLRIPPTELVFASMDGGFVYPGPIDIERLKVALAETLRDHPHAAGRLRCEENKWIIKLTNSSVPITTATTQVEMSDELIQNPHPDLCDTLPWTFAPVGNLEEPLVRIRVTHWEKTGDTSFGIAWLHVLGDGFSEFRFLHSLNQYYIGGEPAAVPTFEKYTNPDPTLERTLLMDVLRNVPHLAMDYAPDAFFDMYQGMMDTTSYINLQFSAEQLQALHKAAKTQSGTKISPGDALAAYLISVLNHVQQTPVRQVITYVDYRGVPSSPGSSYTPPGRLSAGNHVIAHYSEKFPVGSKPSLGDLAVHIRKSLISARDPEYVRRMAAIAEELRGRSAATNRMHWWWPYEDAVAVNNLYKAPFTSIHFGYPGKTKFFTFGTWERFFRIWPGNPERMPDGTWESNEGSVRVFFRLKHHLKSLYLKAVEVDMQDFARTQAKL